MTKRNIICISLLIIFFLSLSVLFGFYDLEISKSLATNDSNLLFRILAAIGEFPIYIGPILFGLVFGFTSENKNIKLCCHFIGLAGTYVAAIRLVKGIFEVFYSSNLGIIQFILLSIVSLLVYILLFMLFNKIKRDTLHLRSFQNHL